MTKSIETCIDICKKKGWQVDKPLSDSYYKLSITIGEKPVTTSRSFVVSKANFANDVDNAYMQFDPEREALNDILDIYDADHDRSQLPSLNTKIEHCELIEEKLRKLSHALL